MKKQNFKLSRSKKDIGEFTFKNSTSQCSYCELTHDVLCLHYAMFRATRLSCNLPVEASRKLGTNHEVESSPFYAGTLQRSFIHYLWIILFISNVSCNGSCLGELRKKSHCEARFSNGIGVQGFAKQITKRINFK